MIEDLPVIDDSYIHELDDTSSRVNTDTIYMVCDMKLRSSNGNSVTLILYPACNRIYIDSVHHGLLHRSSNDINNIGLTCD